jgi:YgiT-type zinc finger domain-containing protein
MADSYAEEKDMKCTIDGCPGQYERRKIVHSVRHRGEVVVIDHVPAEVCNVCGDVLLKPGTIRRIERILRDAQRPAKTAPVYEFV